MISILLSMLVLGSYAENKSLRIIGGGDASYATYPYVISVETLVLFEHVEKSYHQCTGAALTAVWTLTVAHCIRTLEEITTVMHRKPSNVWRHVVRKGFIENFKMTNENYRQIYSTICHPSFSIYRIRGQMVKLQNDIGLLKTERLKMEKYAKLSPVDYSAIIGLQANAVGYGTMNLSKSGAEVESKLGLSKPLQVLDVTITRCDNNYRFIHPVLCVARLCKQTGLLCSGDAGGPIIYRDAIVGVNILGVDCAKVLNKRSRMQDLNLASSMTPISLYLDWILNTIQNSKIEDADKT